MLYEKKELKHCKSNDTYSKNKAANNTTNKYMKLYNILIDI